MSLLEIVFVSREEKVSSEEKRYYKYPRGKKEARKRKLVDLRVARIKPLGSFPRRRSASKDTREEEAVTRARRR